MVDKRYYRLVGLFLIFVLVLSSGVPSWAQTGACDEYPESKYWGNVTHKSVKSYVQRKHGGNWEPYLVKWHKQLDSMKKIHQRDGVAVFKSKKLELTGDKLLEYISDLEKRVAVNSCLSKQP